MAQEQQPQDTEQAQDERRERRRNPWPWLALLIVVLIILWLLWQYLGSGGGDRTGLTGAKSTADIAAPAGIPTQPADPSAAPNPLQPVVPYVVGLTKGEAIAEIRDAGYAPLVREFYGTGHPANRVFHQSPSGGAMLTEGGTVVIQVQQLRPSGATYSMPQLVGLSKSRALSRLSAMGIKPTLSYAPARGDRETGTVYSQWPRVGSTVRSGDEVQIQIVVRP